MSSSSKIIDKFGGQSALAKLLNKRQSTVQHWYSKRIPAKWQGKLIKLAEEHGISLTPGEFIYDGEGEDTLEKKEDFPEAIYSGDLKLGEALVDCYVLDNGERVISLRATVKAIAGVESGSIRSYTEVEGLKPYMDDDYVTNNKIDFKIPGNPTPAKGLRAETFLDICRAYVEALSEGALKTERQKEVAIKCSILLAACSP